MGRQEHNWHHFEVSELIRELLKLNLAAALEAT